MLNISKWKLIKILLFGINWTVSYTEDSRAWYYTADDLGYRIEIKRLD